MLSIRLLTWDEYELSQQAISVTYGQDIACGSHWFSLINQALNFDQPAWHTLPFAPCCIRASLQSVEILPHFRVLETISGPAVLEFFASGKAAIRTFCVISCCKLLKDIVNPDVHSYSSSHSTCCTYVLRFLLSPATALSFCSCSLICFLRGFKSRYPYCHPARC